MFTGVCCVLYVCCIVCVFVCLFVCVVLCAAGWTGAMWVKFKETQQQHLGIELVTSWSAIQCSIH